MKQDPRTEKDLKRALDALARAYVEGDEQLRERLLGALDLKPSPDIAPEARIWITREAEIREALEARAAARRAAKDHISVSVAACMDMLRCCATWISPTSQRVRKSQHELRAILDWQSPRTSAALSELRAVGAVYGPIPQGYTQAWDLDARYCSALTPEAREAACIEQQQARDAAQAGADDDAEARH